MPSTQMNDFPLPALVIRAIELATTWHHGQWRKHPTERIPYAAHPSAVGFLLQRAGFDDEVIAAGILHDVLEDCDVTKEELAENMTPRVAELVSWVTEPSKSLSWKDRKEQFREKLSQAPVEALAIKAADHIANLQSLLSAAKAEPNVWLLFATPREQKLANEEAILNIIASKLQSPLVTLHREMLDRVKKLPG